MIESLVTHALRGLILDPANGSQEVVVWRVLRRSGYHSVRPLHLDIGATGVAISAADVTFRHFFDEGV